MPTDGVRAALLACFTGTVAAGCGLAKGGELALLDDAGGDPSANSSGDGSGAASSGSNGFMGDDASSGSGDSSGSSGSGSGTSGTSGGSGVSSGQKDGGIPPGSCDFSGTWATKLTIGVEWVPQGLMGVILAPGSGAIQQWVKSERAVNGTSTVDTAVVCGISLPDFSSTAIAGSLTFGVRFPDALFDNDYLPEFAIKGTLSDSSPHAKFSTTATAALLGMTLPMAATAAWPTTVTTAVDSDKDKNPGVTVNAALGPLPNDAGSYAPFPVDPFGSLASQLFIVIRQVTALNGAASDCDHISGTVSIPKIVPVASSAYASNAPKFAIDSHVIGCNLIGGGQCSDSQVSFIDGTQPVFSPTQVTAYTSVRMASADCASVRQALP